MNHSMTRYYRCSQRHVPQSFAGDLTEARGYFLFGQESTCYGSHSRQQAAAIPTESLHDALNDVAIEDGKVHLPFDPSQIIDNLQGELYAGNWREGPSSALLNIYYLLRPALPVTLRKHLQRFRLRGWEKLAFPRWPVDCSVDNLEEQLMLLTLRATGLERIPFIWFWPQGASGCAIMTHDVETAGGKKLCRRLMDIDDAFGIKSSFQIIPESRYEVDREFLDSIRERGFEIVVHDLNHDGQLFSNREQFVERVAKINAYGKHFGAEGFRAAVLYRNQRWFDALEFSYDMSVPNVAHLDPQRGGCCTVMPYFVGDVLEIPVTTVQDYTLFHILNDYSIDLWKQQTEIILRKHGCMSFIVHPDYVRKPRELAVYHKLLDHLSRLREEQDIWIAKPGEVNRWWRQRSRMRLAKDRHGWKIVGDGKERASLAYASEENGRLVLTVDGKSTTSDSVAKQEWNLEGAEVVC
jgi:hypothetical protein